MSPFERLPTRFRPPRGPDGAVRGDVANLLPGIDFDAVVRRPDYEEPICVGTDDAHGSDLRAS
jgi:hypothetical protein